MCGIIGLYGDDLNVSVQDKKNFIIEGAIADTVRGYEATGIFSVPRNLKYDPSRIYKKAIAGYDFAQLKQFNKVVDQMGQSIAMVVHNRASTRGHGSVDSNAHPFRFGNITLVHNGTVTNAFQLVATKDRPENIHVDSACVAHAFNHESADDMLPRLQGGYSLVWHDASDNSMHFARNDAKPMFLAFDAKYQVIYFGSELRMVLWLADRNGISISDQVFSLATHTHYIFKNPKKVREIEKRPFVPGRTTPVIVVPPPSNTRTKTTPGIPWEPTKASTTHSAPPMGILGNPPASTPKTGSTTETKHPVQDEKVSAKVAEVLSLPAKVDQRIGQLKALLTQRDMEFGDTVVCIPRQWTPYTTKIREGGELMGAMLCFNKNDPEKKPIYQLFGVSNAEWQSYNSKEIKLEVVNFREKSEFAKEGGIVFVCRLAEEDARQKHLKAGPNVDKDGMVEVGTANKRRATYEWYRAVTDDGCFNCGVALPVSLAHTIHWIGDKDNVPICSFCSDNEQILGTLVNVH